MIYWIVLFLVVAIGDSVSVVFLFAISFFLAIVFVVFSTLCTDPFFLFFEVSVSSSSSPMFATTIDVVVCCITGDILGVPSGVGDITGDIIGDNWVEPLMVGGVCVGVVSGVGVFAGDLWLIGVTSIVGFGIGFGFVGVLVDFLAVNLVVGDDVVVDVVGAVVFVSNSCDVVVVSVVSVSFFLYWFEVSF